MFYKALNCEVLPPILYYYVDCICRYGIIPVGVYDVFLLIMLNFALSFTFVDQ